jgi:UTP--glucose-1-phosphate uridylyltransferase
MPHASSFAPFADRMRAAGQPAAAIAQFERAYRALTKGATGEIPETAIQPVDTLPDAEALAGDADVLARGAAALSKVAVIKLNGGLGTSMGMTRAKSLVAVKDGLSFLDLIAQQVLHLRETHGVQLPVLFMNSFRTRADTLEALAKYPSLGGDLPLDFLQHQVPKVRASDLTPVDHADDALTWCPPGHGDIYCALGTSGMLKSLRGSGVRYAFVSNADNLGAVMDLSLLGHFAGSGAPFMMEVADRTEADKKGGHLARTADGGLLLRERAQCPADDVEAFEDWRRHRFFNTNSLWVDLDAVALAIDARPDGVPLPLIVNRKTVDPTDGASEPVFQLESAMGAAIASFVGAIAVRVPRRRFAPVKTTSDLLALRSDAYVRTEASQVVLAPGRVRAPVITLEPLFYKLVGDFDARFPHGPPSLRRCERLAVAGDVHFGRNIVASGVVSIEHGDRAPRYIADGTVL